MSLFIFFFAHLNAFFFPEYCEKYAKPEDIGAAQEDDRSSEEELSEDGYASSDGDDEVAGKVDPWRAQVLCSTFISVLYI